MASVPNPLTDYERGLMNRGIPELTLKDVSVVNQYVPHLMAGTPEGDAPTIGKDFQGPAWLWEQVKARREYLAEWDRMLGTVSDIEGGPGGVVGFALDGARGAAAGAKLIDEPINSLDPHNPLNIHEGSTHLPSEVETSHVGAPVAGPAQEPRREGGERRGSNATNEPPPADQARGVQNRLGIAPPAVRPPPQVGIESERPITKDARATNPSAQPTQNAPPSPVVVKPPSPPPADTNPAPASVPVKESKSAAAPKSSPIGSIDGPLPVKPLESPTASSPLSAPTSLGKAKAESPASAKIEAATTENKGTSPSSHATSNKTTGDASKAPTQKKAASPIAPKKKAASSVGLSKQNAAPQSTKTPGKSATTQAARAQPAGTPRRTSKTVELTGETAGTGGIKEIKAERDADGSITVQITGEVKPPIPRVNFNAKVPSGKEIGLPGYDVAHLWGAGFGDEAFDGMMYAPKEVNRILQNEGIEGRLREYVKLSGGTLVLQATAESYPRKTWRGHDVLKEAEYRFGERRPDGTTLLLTRVNISVPAPGSKGKVSISASGVLP